MTKSEYQELVEFLGRKFTGVDARFDAVDRRFDTVEATLAEHDERFRDILGRCDALYRRLELLEGEYQAILQALRRIEGLRGGEQVQRQPLERSLDRLKQEVADLRSRIEEMDKDSQTMTSNLLAWAALTDLCLVLRRSVLMATLPEEEAERRLFEEIREFKEARWCTNRS